MIHESGTSNVTCRKIVSYRFGGRCIHTLRHSYATHMLEAGTSVRQVAAYLGHSSLKPVMVYLHLTEISEQRARAALATLASC